ncbi:protein argonaute-2-like isoform X2 [Montipora capricornis]|uniref:protein argonaute-2-like isoform X2 n=1 Tax=Montipora capricornis TaxID=246305 RepID=UPI0035F1F8B7
MSSIEYRNLLKTTGRCLEEFHITELLYLCEGKIQDGNEQNIPNIRTLFKEMEANNTLGIDRLENLREILRVHAKWRLFREAGKFQIKRKKYNDLLQQISEALDESIAMEQLILICRRQVLEEIEGNINDTRSLLRKLETQNNLEFSRLDILKEVLNSVEKEDLLIKVEEFERWRNDEDESACRGGERADMFANARSLGGRLLGVLNMKTICKVTAAGITLLTVNELLKRSDTCEQLMASFNACVLPAGTQLMDIRQGCVCFTIKADNLASLRILWNMYQDGTLKLRVKNFVLTEEMIKLAGGEENIEVTVTIEEEEYEKACFVFIREQGGAKPGKTIRRNSDSALSALPNEDEVSLVKLKQLENAFELHQQERIANLEKEVERLPKLFLQTESPQTMDEKGKDQALKVQEFVDPFPWSRITESSSDSGIEGSLPGFELKMREEADDTAHHSSGSDVLLPPKRPGYGTVGWPIQLRANFFRLNVSPKLTCLYHYDVEITPKKCPKATKRDVMNAITQKYKEVTFQGHEPAFDGEKNLISLIELPSPVELSVTLPGEDGNKQRKFKVKIQFAACVRLVELKAFLQGKQNEKMAQDALHKMDIILRQIPSNRFTPIGRSFFPFGGFGRTIGEGCEVHFGFYQNVERPSEWKVMLVNIDVSPKVFYRSQPVIDLLCETLVITPLSLKDRRFQIDKEKFKKAVIGVRIETTHLKTMKRKYTVRGLSGESAESLQFDEEDETTGQRTKTTVAQYFYKRYGISLKYPHLPCLQVGQKKDCYLPMEVCTIIPGQKRHLSEQQITNLIRTSRPALERQRDIQWSEVQEMIKASGKYLREEFQTTVDPEMVAVEGRVLPPPKLKLGPQDEGLIPRDGSWDMRNRALFEGVRIDIWALACFAPIQTCNQDTLKTFCDRMSSVSTREGMRMTAQPVVVRYARGLEDVEGLFSNWYVEIPRLQLIMVVLSGNDRGLYSEVKRVGDCVIGIPTQCVQLKLVQEAKPQFCSNISLKINTKLGGTNHVIDFSDKPVFTEPTIVFGADVTHPPPSEIGIPSIAAVVASMDHHAAKYQARVRVQRHEKGRDAREIINDLAEIVRELLIEFYKANAELKPSKIIFYRNGVSEGQFDQVFVHEVRAVQEACVKLQKDYQPRITFVVVQKRHHTRLFRENNEDSSGKGRNIPPGTIVDSGITHPYEFDFYLCSHYGIQETSRPTHYHVLYDDNNFTADSLEQLTYQLCHLCARFTRSECIPAPVYHARLAALRARDHMATINTGHVDLEECAKAIQVSDKMKDIMYFI